MSRLPNFTDSQWSHWNTDPDSEGFSYKRSAGALPAMSSTIQLTEILRDIYVPGMHVLDVGCATGHYLNGLLNLDPEILYHGIDATPEYIEAAKRFHENKRKSSFEVADIYDLPIRHSGAFDVVFCCNVLLHLPSIKIPLQNLLRVSRRFLIVRTLISEESHMSYVVRDDKFDSTGTALSLIYQNTYSYQYLKSLFEEFDVKNISFIDDHFDATEINEEWKDRGKYQFGSTRVADDVQIAGNKVFRWAWILVDKYSPLSK